MDDVGNVYSDGEDLLRSGVTCDGCSKLINDIKAGKHDELLSEMTNDDRIEIMDALGTICKSIHADNNNADVIPYKCMSTRSSARNLFPPLDIPELTIRRIPSVDPTLLNDFEMATDRNDDPPLPDLRTMEELCQPTLNGRGGPIAPIATQATNFGLKNDMI
nr:reverse transcriptase domain-containing protein [Tanacetum cinerariifolium]